MGKRQHYVPRFYLRNFSDNGKTVGYFKIDERLYKSSVSIDSIMWEKWLYDNDNQLENRLSRSEREWNQSITRLLGALRDNADFSLDCVDISTLLDLLMFICCSYLRTKYMINNIHDSISSIITDLKSLLPEADDSGSSDINKYNDRYNYPEIILSCSRNMINSILDLDCVFLRNLTSREFITSDNPVVILNSLFTVKRIRKPFGLRSKGLQILFILSPKDAILLYDSSAYTCKLVGRVINICESSTARKVNSIVAGNAVNQLIFHQGYPRCELVGLCGSRANHCSGSVVRYSDSNDNILYAMSGANLFLSLDLEEIKIRDDALDSDYLNNGAVLIRDSIFKSTLFPDGCQTIVARPIQRILTF